VEIEEEYPNAVSWKRGRRTRLEMIIRE